MRWFKPLGFLFAPVSVMGWLVTLLAGAFCAQVFWVIDRHSHSASDTFYGVFPFWIPTLLVLAWVADKTGGRQLTPPDLLTVVLGGKRSSPPPIQSRKAWENGDAW